LAGGVVSPMIDPVPSLGMLMRVRPEKPESFSFSTPMAMTTS
jgi:hypothetical protein